MLIQAYNKYMFTIIFMSIMPVSGPDPWRVLFVSETNKFIIYIIRILWE